MVFLHPCALDKSSHSIERVKKLSKKIEYTVLVFVHSKKCAWQGGRVEYIVISLEK